MFCAENINGKTFKPLDLLVPSLAFAPLLLEVNNNKTFDKKKIFLMYSEQNIFLTFYAVDIIYSLT